MTTPIPNVEKPKRPPGSTCPLMGGRDVSKVCHTCDFYQVIQGKVMNKSNPDDPGKWFDNWACTLAHSHMFQAQIAFRMEENTIEQNVLRNQLAEAAAKTDMLMAQVGRTIEALMQQVALANHQRQQVINRARSNECAPDMVEFSRSQ
jgi:hypothetical protein